MTSKTDLRRGVLLHPFSISRAHRRHVVRVETELAQSVETAAVAVVLDLGSSGAGGTSRSRRHSVAAARGAFRERDQVERGGKVREGARERGREGAREKVLPQRRFKW